MEITQEELEKISGGKAEVQKTEDGKYAISILTLNDKEVAEKIAEKLNKLHKPHHGKGNGFGLHHHPHHPNDKKDEIDPGFNHPIG